MTEYKGIAIFGEVKNRELASITLEGLGIGRKLADELGQELSLILLGSEVSASSQQAFIYGADKVYIVDDPLLKDYQADLYIAAMEDVIEVAMPTILIMGQTDIGRDLAPILSFRFGTTVTMDCIDLVIDRESQRLLRTKPVYGGNAQVVVTSDTNPQIVTIRSKVMIPLQPDTSKQGDVINIDAELDSSLMRTRVLDTVKEEVAGIKLEEAEVVVAGGRGIGNSEGFEQLEELATLLNGAVGATRPPCDNDWVPDTLQVGLTGKIIAPNVYFAVALSGSSQHLSGCSGSKHIIAINKDPEANIFRYARFGVVGNWRKVLPVFTEKIMELLVT